VSDLFAIVDTARDKKLYGLVAPEKEQQCLFAGELDPVLARASPYLVRLDEGSALMEAWRREGWGQAWGILLRSPHPFNDVRRHFRNFMQAKLPDGAIVLFRFYDPRVWRTYLPTCEGETLASWFAKVDEYQVETPAGDGMIRYALSGGALVTETEGPAQAAPTGR
jgi:hypothetical protein